MIYQCTSPVFPCVSSTSDVTSSTGATDVLTVLRQNKRGITAAKLVAESDVLKVTGIG
jgi:hypothetical protein